MKSKTYCKILILFLIASILLMGCWNRRELNDLALVIAVGVELVPGSDKVKVTAQVMKPGELQAGGGSPGQDGGGGNKPYWNVVSTGDTVFDAIRAATHQIDRKLYFPHNQIIVFSEEVAKKGINEYLDIFARDPEFRHNVYVMVSRAEVASVFDTKSELEKVPGLNISQLAEAQAATSQASVVTLQEFMGRLVSKTTSPIASVLDVSELSGGNTALLTGTSIFKKDKLAGYLNKEETRGMLWATGKIRSGIVVVACPEGQGKASLEIIQASGKISPLIKEYKLGIKVTVDIEANLGSQMCMGDITKQEDLEKLEKIMTDEVEKEILASLKKARELNTDIFGFGSEISKRYPKVWKEIENEWDQYFQDIEVIIDIKAKLRRTGLLAKQIKPQ